MAIRVISFVDGIYIGGVAHPGAPAYYADDFFTKEQIKELKEKSWTPSYSGPLFVEFDIDPPFGWPVHGSTAAVAADKAEPSASAPVDSPVKRGRGRPKKAA